MGSTIKVDRNRKSDEKQLTVAAKLAKSVEQAVLLQQKSSKVFRVQLEKTGEIGLCRFANKPAKELESGEMTFTVVGPKGEFYASEMTSKFVWDFAENKFQWTYDTATGVASVVGVTIEKQVAKVETPSVTEPAPVEPVEAPAAVAVEEAPVEPAPVEEVNEPVEEPVVETPVEAAVEEVVEKPAKKSGKSKAAKAEETPAETDSSAE